MISWTQNVLIVLILGEIMHNSFPPSKRVDLGEENTPAFPLVSDKDMSQMDNSGQVGMIIKTVENTT